MIFVGTPGHQIHQITKALRAFWATMPWPQILCCTDHQLPIAPGTGDRHLGKPCLSYPKKIQKDCDYEELGQVVLTCCSISMYHSIPPLR